MNRAPKELATCLYFVLYFSFAITVVKLGFREDEETSFTSSALSLTSLNKIAVFLMVSASIGEVRYHFDD